MIIGYDYSGTTHELLTVCLVVEEACPQQSRRAGVCGGGETASSGIPYLGKGSSGKVSFIEMWEFVDGLQSSNKK
jgi:hypothetical protein